MVKAVAAGVGKVNLCLIMKYLRRGITKNTPKKPAVEVRAINFPASCLGESERRPSAYNAGIAETKRIPRPPAAGNFEMRFLVRQRRMEVLTRGSGLNGTVLLRTERTAENLSDDGLFGDGSGQWLDNGKTENSL